MTGTGEQKRPGARGGDGPRQAAAQGGGTGRPGVRSGPEGEALSRLAALMRRRRVLVLSGAGISTESGIPDYRGPGSRPSRPVYYREFVSDPRARARYWARSTLGWPLVSRAGPNAGHAALARLQAGGVVDGVITQNVDGLHQAAGSRRVLELHGSLARVLCLGCGSAEAREALQARLLQANPGWSEQAAFMSPDGDAAIDPGLVRAFRVPACLRCGGALKPDVVFFGESVPSGRVQRAWRMLEAAEVLLVAGSSLTVWSGFRFVTRAAEGGKPVAIVNRGPTRGDALASVRVGAALGQALSELCAMLLGA